MHRQQYKRLSQRRQKLSAHFRPTVRRSSFIRSTARINENYFLMLRCAELLCAACNALSGRCACQNTRQPGRDSNHFELIGAPVCVCVRVCVIAVYDSICVCSLVQLADATLLMSVFACRCMCACWLVRSGSAVAAAVAVAVASVADVVIRGIGQSVVSRCRSRIVSAIRLIFESRECFSCA